MRPLLRPGTHLLRRADGSVQLGLDPAQAVVVDGPELCAGLLDGSVSTRERFVAELDDHGLLVDEKVLMPLVGRTGTGRLPRAAGAALARHGGHEAGTRAAGRDQTRAVLTGFGHPDGDDLVAALADLLARSGVRRQRTRPTGPPARRRHRLVGILVGVGEPDRELADQWMRDQTPYMVVRLTEGRAVVGPFVVPGRTACLRCLDAHHTDADPEWPLLVRQYAEAARHDRADGVPEPIDPALAALAVAWAARDVTTYADGGLPSTWSGTLALHPDLAALETRSWLRHPECGCAWG